MLAKRNVSKGPKPVEIADFPFNVGCLDGTSITFKAPIENEGEAIVNKNGLSRHCPVSKIYRRIYLVECIISRPFKISRIYV